MNNPALQAPSASFSKASRVDGILTVSCAADPYDLRPALDVLEEEINRRARNGPLVVLMGETHTMSAHKALQQGLLARLSGSSAPGALHTGYRMACGMEWPHNMLEKILKTSLGFDIPMDLCGQVSAADPDGVWLMRAFQAAVTPVYAPLTNSNLRAFCQRHAVSVRGNDVAEQYKDDGEVVLDQSDPLTHALVERHDKNLLGAAISIDVCEGIALRNWMLVEQGLQHMRDTEAQVYVQGCGRDHLLGNISNRRTDSYSDSLTARFAEAGVDVLPVFITESTMDCDNLEEAGQNKLRESGMVIEGLSAESFRATWREQQENTLLNNIHDHSGDEFELFPAGGPLGRWWRCRQLRNEISRVYKTAPNNH